MRELRDRGAASLFAVERFDDVISASQSVIADTELISSGFELRNGELVKISRDLELRYRHSICLGHRNESYLEAIGC